MLQELTIKNFAIISSLHLSFTNGMTALTGETGAGKSIIIDAVSLLAGARSSIEYIRQGSDKCLVEGLFDLPEQQAFYLLMEELGIEVDEAELIVQRDLNISGKSISRVNGRIVTLANLRRIGQFLVDIQGQNDHQELMHPESHLRLLDSFGDTAFQKIKATYQTAYKSYVSLANQVKKFKRNEQSFAQRIDMLTFQQEEISNAGLVIGEEEKLVEEREKLTNYQKIVDSLSYSYQAMTSEETSALDAIGSASQELQTIASLDKEYETISDNVHSAYYLLQDAVSEIGRQLDLLELDEERLDLVNERLELIHQLKRKYGDSIEVILDYYNQISQELLDSDFSGDKLEKLEQELATKVAKLQKLAEKLQIARKKMAKKLEAAIQAELKGLYMENARFEVTFKTISFEGEGIDEVEFYITTNPGEPLKPLVKVASGGEISRVMLALKTIFSKTQGLTSIVFDEVDTGVSGRVAQAIADKIYQIGQNSQALCITHLPQVAAKADHQLFIRKEVIAGRTVTKVEELAEGERTKEIARMLAGTEITDLSVEHAKELLQLAKK
ncbi:DNA repair protein RecN [Enterococcus dongliensis]|uniref:DNA repair protein RecN n=1 Tax=Enterococcus dongliensis TaxID=2559925 RepID=A0AAP5KQS7_9ENTE|nr:DNA repair protein RecN [Enterococcus dongliensis]MDT2596820.1 DNA repair protein RecN [Enterococcus dongliensis]MDT2603162.1 DNA repair protein RecN [Enterococcus dongliensis]MDT2633506.1 DNA repair protein RecN [Enterococcus dongliensis]MDT2636120.1 DNA repair protein RecN [Enterococcus dongliensis]MDT2638974.1 DNA repair protein RecN [Enterococcus dongliensis]